MANIQFLNNDNIITANVSRITDNVVQLTGNIPVNTSGFVVTNMVGAVFGNYESYNTVYRTLENGYQLSNDGSVYVAPDDVIEENPEPTLADIKDEKISEINATSQSVIHAGFEVTLTDGSKEHFTLGDSDQISLMGLATMVASGIEQIPWHTSDLSEHCKFYSNADMNIITSTALQYMTYHVTYAKDLCIYVKALRSKDKVNAVQYGMEIPEAYQSEPLKAMMAQM